MKIGRVSATVVATVSVPDLDGRRLLLVDLLDPDGNETGRTTIAVDSIGTGTGETVLLLDEGNSARQVLRAPEAPIRAVIVGIVDEIAVESRPLTGPAR